jgi:hypothetical protein
VILERTFGCQRSGGASGEPDASIDRIGVADPALAGNEGQKKKAMFVIAAAVGVSVVPAGAAFAGNGVQYSDQHGYEVSGEHSCNHDHGAYGYYGGYDNNLGINDLGSNGAPGAANPHNPAPGGITTGQNNSDFSASCNS